MRTEKELLQGLTMLPLSSKIQTNSQLPGAMVHPYHTKWTIRGLRVLLRFKTSTKMPNSSSSSSKSNCSCKLMSRLKRLKITQIKAL